jgi:hypothetical protein
MICPQASACASGVPSVCSAARESSVRDVEPSHRAGRVEVAELRCQSERQDIEGRTRVSGKHSERTRLRHKWIVPPRASFAAQGRLEPPEIENRRWAPDTPAARSQHGKAHRTGSRASSPTPAAQLISATY